MNERELLLQHECCTASETESDGSEPSFGEGGGVLCTAQPFGALRYHACVKGERQKLWSSRARTYVRDPNRRSYRTHTASVSPANVQSGPIDLFAIGEVTKTLGNPVDSLQNYRNIPSRLWTPPVRQIPVGTGWRRGQDSPKAGDCVSIVTTPSIGRQTGISHEPLE